MAATVLGAIALTACTSATAQPRPAPSAPPPAAAPLATTLVTGQGAWAVLPMGDTSSSENTFWQVFVRPRTGAAGWQLATPPGVAANGGLVSAGTDSELIVGFLPSARLTLSPLAASGDAGRTWTPDVIDAPLASVPGALAASAAGQQAALLTDSTIESKASDGTWSKLAAIGDIAASAPGRSCGVRAMSALSFWSEGELVAATDCTRPGIAGIFIRTSGGWLAAGPALPASYANTKVSVLRLGDQAALLRAGGDLLASWGQRVSDPLSGVTGVSASGFGAAVTSGQSMWVLLADGRAATIAPGGTWQLLPKAPAGTEVVVPDQGQTQALAASGGTLTVWRLAGRSWTLVQTIKVPINSGSSG
ncbi:MAG TPA: hypothetical protein VKU39_16555 [Streptosporangiaceae bacterium]|nr:hypothetical protein [Streptosporangiaceae bacterium]